jgi:hypothetical protein
MKPWPNEEYVDLGSCFPTLAAKTKTRRGWGNQSLFDGQGGAQ